MIPLLAGLFLGNPPKAHGQEPPLGRPKTILVLSGGGARGAAHIGVLKGLERLRVPVDAIVGTSMGAVVGGLYAAGLSPEEIETLAAQADWRDLFSDQPPRDDLDYRRKQDDYDNFFRFELGVRGASLTLPRGIVAGQKFLFLLETATLGAAGARTFDDLPIPFRAVATDLCTGDAVVLDRGNLAQAIRASMAIPGVFSPVEREGSLLADGMLVQNLPIAAAEGMGPGRIIAVDVGTTLLPRTELESVVGISAQVLHLLTLPQVRNQQDLLEPEDILLLPELGDIATSDFPRVLEAVRLGEKAALAREDALRSLAVPSSEWEGFLHRQRGRDVPPVRLDFLRVVNRSGVSTGAVRRQVRTGPGDPFDLDALREDLRRIYSRGDFETVEFSLETETEGDRRETGLTIRTQGKSWGPNYLRFGLTFGDDFEGDTSFGFLAAYNRRLVNRLGGEWKVRFQMGTTRRFSAEFFQPLERSETIFVAPRLFYGRKETGVFEGDRETALFAQRDLGAGLDLGAALGRWGEVRLGLQRTNSILEPQVGTPPYPDEAMVEKAFTFGLTFDRMDNPNFPRRGWSLNLAGLGAREGLGSDDAFDKVSFSLAGAAGWGRNAWVGLLDVRSALGSDLPFPERVRLGGFLNLSGYKTGQLDGQHSALGRLLYYRRLGDLPPGVGRGIHLGASLEGGGVWETLEEARGADYLLAGSVFLGADTNLGPLYFGYGRAEAGNDALYLFLGRTF